MSVAVAGVAALELAGIRKRFGRLQVLDGVDAVLAPGRVTAIVGPNAAGKSTLIKCVLGLVRPDEGRIRVLGEEIGTDPGYRRRIGYMPQGAPFPENLTGQEVLRMLTGLRGGAETDDELLHRFGLGPELAKPIRTLSGGTRQKLNAVVAFLFRPALVVLDEPTAGLDPLASGVLKEKVRDAVEQGTTVVLTSHIMSEIEELASEVIFLVEGRVHFQGTMEQLRRTTGEQRLERAVARLMRARVA
ncbi:MAG TPA: ABC transporter ATP-binding protein [Gemmatimonadales bacterium]|nr:ABC transporter ATP-binding protein [Gemmatimonadales bacterium]